MFSGGKFKSDTKSAFNFFANLGVPPQKLAMLTHTKAWAQATIAMVEAEGQFDLNNNTEISDAYTTRALYEAALFADLNVVARDVDRALSYNPGNEQAVKMKEELQRWVAQYDGLPCDLR
jgi:hypothetical protein